MTNPTSHPRWHPRWHPLRYEAHTLFLWIAVCVGSFFILIVPPFAFWDEWQHVLRIIELAMGKWNDRAYAPEHIRHFIDFWHQRNKEYLASGGDNGSPYHFDDIFGSPPDALSTDDTPSRLTRGRGSVYFFPPYIPAIMVAWAGLHTGMGAYPMFMLMRLSLFASATWLLYQAIRITPLFKWQFFLLALFPVNTLIRSTLNADPLTIGYAFMMLALILDNAVQDKPVSNRRIMALILLAALLCTCKSTYLLLPAAIVFIPQRRYASRRQYGCALMGMLIFAPSLGVASLLMAQQIAGSLPYLQQPGMNATQQMMFIAEHPLRFLQILLHTWHKDFFIFARGMFDFSSLGLFADDHLPDMLIFGLYLLLFLLPDAEVSSFAFSNGSRLLSAMIGLGTVLIFCVIFYAFTTLVGADAISYIRGRYFLFALPFFLIAGQHRARGQETMGLLVAAAIIFLLESLLWCCWMVVYHYYVL